MCYPVGYKYKQFVSNWNSFCNSVPFHSMLWGAILWQSIVYFMYVFSTIRVVACCYHVFLSQSKVYSVHEQIDIKFNASEKYVIHQ